MRWDSNLFKTRCPHDGGACHHSCKSEDDCYREATGCSLSSPHEGYPLPGHEPELETGFDQYVQEQMKDPEFRKAFLEAQKILRAKKEST